MYVLPTGADKGINGVALSSIPQILSAVEAGVVFSFSFGVKGGLDRNAVVKL